jgi:hypothetical protein
LRATGFATLRGLGVDAFRGVAFVAVADGRGARDGDGSGVGTDLNPASRSAPLGDPCVPGSV